MIYDRYGKYKYDPPVLEASRQVTNSNLALPQWIRQSAVAGIKIHLPHFFITPCISINSSALCWSPPPPCKILKW